jgi:hypothetical protein
MKTTLLRIFLTAVLVLLLSSAVLAQTETEYRPVPKSKDTHPAYITEMYSKQGKTYIVADCIQWYEGADADRVFKEREPDSGLPGTPDGYYIVNDNPKLRTIAVKDDAEVLMQVYNRTGKIDETNVVWNEAITLSKWSQIYSEDKLLAEYPYHLTIKNGEIVKIIQQYIP